MNSRHVEVPSGHPLTSGRFVSHFSPFRTLVLALLPPRSKPHVYCPGHRMENISLGQPSIKFPSWRDKILSVQTQRLSFKRVVCCARSCTATLMANPAAFWNGNKSLLWFCCFNVHFPPLSMMSLGSFERVILNSSACIALPQTERGNWECKGLVIWHVLTELGEVSHISITLPKLWAWCLHDTAGVSSEN